MSTRNEIRRGKVDVPTVVKTRPEPRKMFSERIISDDTAPAIPYLLPINARSRSYDTEEGKKERKNALIRIRAHRPFIRHRIRIQSVMCAL